jgi:hypothetical protein
MPFLGLALLTIDRTDIIEIPAMISWIFMLLPGPMYVHLSWAPRWRLLCMIEDGKNPFETVENEDKNYQSFAVEEIIEDAEIMSVVDDFESE